MKLKHVIPTLMAVLLPASVFSATLADWTFETSQPATAGPISPEVGAGQASGSHASGATVYSTPAGNGSSHSYSANTWTVNDYWQFTVSTTGATAIIVNWNHNGSSTGPRDFAFKYSIDGVNFATATNYQIPSGITWSSGTSNAASFFSLDLSAITALNNQPTIYFRLVDTDTTSIAGGTVATAGTDRVDNFMVTAQTGTAPSWTSLTPSTEVTNAGNNVPFVATLSAGDLPITYSVYKINGASSNLLFVATNSGSLTQTLTLSNVLAADSGSYNVVAANAAGAASSGIVTLTVTDPAINQGPVNQTALVGGSAQFTVLAGGTGLTYKWYYTDGSGNITGLVNDGALASGAVVSGSTSNALTISGLGAGDGANFVVTVSGTGGGSPVTSSMATLTVVSTGGTLAFWNFNSSYFNISNPVPYVGIGTASSMNVTPFLQPNPDDDDSTPTPPANTAWGTQDYPASTSLNKQAGVQFMTSTLGANDIKISFDVRGTSTASHYQRLQFTTNGTDFIDYPVAQSIPAGQVGTYVSFAYDLTGVPGVANNTNFGIRIVSEFESTALNNNTNDANYIGVSTNYGTAGTLSYDIVNITGDSIVPGNQPPTVSAIGPQAMSDGHATNVIFTVSDDHTAAGSINVVAASLDSSVSPSFTYANNSGTVTLGINTALNNTAPYYVPIQITATDSAGAQTVVWFTLTINPNNAPPVVSGLTNTNMLVNTSLPLTFGLSDDHTPVNSLVLAVSSGNSSVVPNDASHLALSGTGSTRTLTVTPIPGTEGVVPVTVSATDSGSLTGTANFYVEVRPNTNVVLIDYFDYDTAGPIDTVSFGLWANYSGHLNEMAVGGGVVTIDGVNHTEDVNAPLIGAPYDTNSVLYSSFIINYSTIPGTNGSYICYFKDDTTSNFLGRVWAFTNGAAPGFYRIGIANITNTSTYVAANAVYPQDLSLGSNYFIVTRLVMSNWFSTLWLNPLTQSSPSVTDTQVPDTTATNMSFYALRESTADEGILTIDHLKVGTTFDSVFPSLHIATSGTNAVLTWSDATVGLQSSTNVAGPYTDIPSAAPGYVYTNHAPINAVFFKLGH